jgi:hypothetical protein
MLAAFLKKMKFDFTLESSSPDGILKERLGFVNWVWRPGNDDLNPLPV